MGNLTQLIDDGLINQRMLVPMHIGPDGRLIKGATSDSGVFQVLLYTHRDHYGSLGLDPRQVDDNIKFARVLVEGRLARGSWAYADWVCA